MHLDFPYRFDGRGRTAATDAEDHLRDLIEQVLFTAPGERVNRPSFGCGLLQLVFAPGSDELAAATQFLVQGALQEWLGERIEVAGVDVSAADGRLTVKVEYRPRQSQDLRVATFTREGGTP
jgi:phage baseplate assembly protein W